MKTTNGCLLAAGVAASLTLTSLRAAETATVNGDNVNVRGQPTLTSEVVTQLKKGETVVVLEQIELKKPKTGDPAKWVRIQMPSNTPVWLNSEFIDTNHAVVPLKLNLRAGPSENYSVLGRLDRGQIVKPIRTVENWTEVEGPTNAFAFVAADLVTIVQTPPTLVEKAAEPAKAVEPTPAAAKPAEAKPAEPPAATPPPAETNPAEVKPAEPKPEPAAPPKAAETKPAEPVVQEPPAAAPPSPGVTEKVLEPPPFDKPATASPVASPAKGQPEPAKPAAAAPALTPPPVAPALPKVEEPAPRRVVVREGVISGAVSIQSPTYFELRSPDTKKLLNYLHPMTTNLVLKKLRGRLVQVKGEEFMDARWASTPVINIDTLRILP